MERWSGKVAIVTGASVGIGAAIVKALVKHSVQVVGCARNLEKLQELGSTLDGPGSFRPVKCDVTKEEDILSLFEVARKEYKGLHILVNNVGTTHVGPLLESRTEDLRDMMEINVIALTVCSREAVKLMREFNIDDGHIININSLLGRWVPPVEFGMNFYTATKYAVTALTHGIRNELGSRGSQIRVSQITPGMVKNTEMAARAMGEEMAAMIHGSMKCLDPDDIAASVIHVLSAPAYCCIFDVMPVPIDQELHGPAFPKASPSAEESSPPAEASSTSADPETEQYTEFNVRV